MRVVAAGALCALAGVCLAAPKTPALRKVSLDLPGPPARIVPADLNGDGLTDLVVALAWSEFETVEFERLEGFVQMTTLVPALFDRREMRAYLQSPGGTYELAGAPLPLPSSVLALDAGPSPTPVVALTDEGVAGLKLEGTAFVRVTPTEVATYDCDPSYAAKTSGPVLERAKLDADRISQP